MKKGFVRVSKGRLRAGSFSSSRLLNHRLLNHHHRDGLIGISGKEEAEGREGGCEWEARAGARASSVSAALHGIVLKKLKEP